MDYSQNSYSMTTHRKSPGFWSKTHETYFELNKYIDDFGLGKQVVCGYFGISSRKREEKSPDLWEIIVHGGAPKEVGQGDGAETGV